MYTVTIEASFNAIHAVLMPDGSLEPPHGHDWRVHAVFSADRLDDRGMVVDFELARSTLRKVLAGFHHRDLNQLAAFEGCYSTAEVVAARIFALVTAQKGLSSLQRVEVGEAPGCMASYEP